MATINFEELKRTKTRSFITDPELLAEADRILEAKNTNVSLYCHEKILQLVKLEHARQAAKIK